jgi:NPCBM/NEW2 domain
MTCRVHNSDPLHDAGGAEMVKNATLRVFAAAIAAATVASACSGGGISSSQPSPSAAATGASNVTPSPGSASGSPSPPVSAPGSPSASSPGQAVAGQFLAALNPVSGSGDLFTGSAEVNGQYFANSVYLDLNPGPGNVSYNLGRQWRELDATVGLSDNSPENEKVQFQVFADGRSIYNHVFQLGQSQQITLNVTGVLRLELVATLASALVGQTEAVWGNASLTS